MLALMIATVFSAGFGLVLRAAQGRRCNLWAVGLVNYVLAAAINAVRHVPVGDWTPSPSTLPLGIVSGVLYAFNFWLYFTLIRKRGVSITTAIVRLAVLVPILGSIFLWRESADGTQAAGVVLAVMALPLLTLGDGQGARMERDVLWASLAMLAGSGLSMLTVEAFEQLAPPSESALFLAILFGSAMVVTLASWLRHRAGSAWADLPFGIALGLCNTISNVGLVAALQQLPGMIVFPLYSVGGVVVASVAARFLWQERLTRLEATGVAVALAAVVLMNLG